MVIGFQLLERNLFKKFLSSQSLSKKISYAEHYHFRFKRLLILKVKMPFAEERSAWPYETIGTGCQYSQFD